MNSPDITLLLGQVDSGEPEAAARLFDAVYGELRAIATGKMGGERKNHTLQPTALVHEAFVRLVGNVEDFNNRAHFFGAAAKAMERVLVDHAREKNALKRGGGGRRVTFDELRVVTDRANSPGTGGHLDVLAVHETLGKLEKEDERLARLVRYRYFVGMRLEDIAEVTGDSLSTVRRQWAFARAWLHTELSDREKTDQKSPQE